MSPTLREGGVKLLAWSAGIVRFIQPMEILLNVVWVLVAIVAFRVWSPGTDTGRPVKGNYNQLFGILALVCALALLFPVISLTDDLHTEQAALEDSSTTAMKAQDVLEGCLRAGSSSVVVAVTHVPHSAAARYQF